jgi:tetratricopeptide (TPR) repeat protein
MRFARQDAWKDMGMAKRRQGRQMGSLIDPSQLPPLNNETINEIARMIDMGRFVEAIIILEALREQHPREAILYKLLGTGYAEMGDLAGAGERWEEAQRLDPGDPSLWRLLTGVYQLQGRIVHALRSLRRYLAEETDDPDADQLEQLREGLEAAVADLGEQHGVSASEAERAGLLLERGLRQMEEEDALAATRLFRDASRIMPNWTAPKNNLALCQFLLGNTDTAIGTAEGILASAPDDLHARAGLVRFLTITGRRAEGLAHADHLWGLVQAANEQETREVGSARFDFERAADAFALLEQDERVIGTLDSRAHEALSGNGLLMLGAALANVNRKPGALAIFKELEGDPLAARLSEALQLSETPPGRRFSALSPADLAPPKVIDRAAKEIDRILDDPALADDKTARQGKIQDVLQSAPTFLSSFYLSLWLGDEIASVNAVTLLLHIGTPEAIEAVRTFAFGRLGPDDLRLFAALSMRREGLLEWTRPQLLWQDGRYQEMLPPRYELTPADETLPYPAAIKKLMLKALDRRAENDLEGAARLYRQALAQDPSITEAEQQLGLIAILGDDNEGAEQHLSRALSIAPESVLARTTLASLRISQGRTREARDLLIPLVDRTTFAVNEFASYLFTTAELAFAEQDFSRARQQLRLLLAHLPTHQPARLRLRELEREEAERRKAEEQKGKGVGGLVRNAMGNIPILGQRKQ